jgi:hypothetical protein
MRIAILDEKGRAEISVFTDDFADDEVLAKRFAPYDIHLRHARENIAAETPDRIAARAEAPCLDRSHQRCYRHGCGPYGSGVPSCFTPQTAQELLKRGAGCLPEPQDDNYSRADCNYRAPE